MDSASAVSLDKLWAPTQISSILLVEESAPLAFLPQELQTMMMQLVLMLLLLHQLLHQLLELLMLLLQVLLQLLVLLGSVVALGPSRQPLGSLVPGQAQQHSH